MYFGFLHHIQTWLLTFPLIDFVQQPADFERLRVCAMQMTYFVWPFLSRTPNHLILFFFQHCHPRITFIALRSALKSRSFSLQSPTKPLAYTPSIYADLFLQNDSNRCSVPSKWKLSWCFRGSNQSIRTSWKLELEQPSSYWIQGPTRWLHPQEWCRNRRQYLQICTDQCRALRIWAGESFQFPEVTSLWTIYFWKTRVGKVGR